MARESPQLAGAARKQGTPRDGCLRCWQTRDFPAAPGAQEFPSLSYTTNLGAALAALFFGIVFVFAFLTTVVIILKSIVMEKAVKHHNPPVLA